MEIDDDAVDARPLCQFGDACYRLNPEHLHSKAHPLRESKLQILVFRPQLIFFFRILVEIKLRLWKSKGIDLSKETETIRKQIKILAESSDRKVKGLC